MIGCGTVLDGSPPDVDQLYATSKHTDVLWLSFVCIDIYASDRYYCPAYADKPFIAVARHNDMNTPDNHRKCKNKSE